MNDSKYGRLYPERAVAPMRELSKKWLAWASRMDAKGAAELTAVLEDLETLGFPPDEPLFLLRGQDDLAAEVVRFYIGRAVVRFAFIAKECDHLMDFADRMEAWQPRKLPD